MSCGEVSDAQDLRVTLKSDVFAFAVTMWEMATRMHPWHGLGVMVVCAFPDGVWWLCAVFAGIINGQCMRSKPLHPHALARLHALAGSSARALLPNSHTHTHTNTHSHTHARARLHANKLLAQVATKVVAQNARLPIAPVEQVRQQMVASRRAFNYSNFVQG